MRRWCSKTSVGSAIVSVGFRRYIKVYGRLCRVLFFLVLLTRHSPCALAEDLELPKGVGVLPDLSKGAKSGVLVASQQSHLYRMLLPTEVASMLDRGELAFEAVGGLRYPWRFVVPERVSSAAPVPELSSSSSGMIHDPSGGKALVSPVFDLPRAISGDPLKLAYKVLWNAAGALWRYSSFITSASLLIFRSEQSSPNELEFEVARVHPRKLGEHAGTLEPIFRERILFKNPAVIGNLAWLSFRFFGSGEDFLWAASPVINQIRQMTGSNRSDEIFSGIFSPDDLFGWSGKVELVEPSGIKLVPLLVPIIEANQTKVEARHGCNIWQFNGDDRVTANQQSARFKGAAAWVPTNVLMALRSVWRVDLTSRDPFTLDTRQVIYLDRETGLPVYRIVWDDAGRLTKVTIGIMRYLEREGLPPEPIIAGEIVAHASGADRVLIRHDAFSVCTGYHPERSKDEFDPSSFVRFAKLGR